MLDTSSIVYLVDDDRSVAKSISRLLKLNGINSLIFHSAEEFLAYDRPAGDACLLLDINLPDLGGLDLHEHLRSQMGPPVVFITGCGDVSSSVRAMKAGAVDFLEKPFEESALLRAVETALEQHNRHRQMQSHMRTMRSRYSLLTFREREVMKHVVVGQMNKQIAGDLGIAEKTVKVHRGRVMEKMEATSLAELVLMAEDLGLLKSRDFANSEAFAVA